MKNIGIVCYPTFGGSGIVATELGIELSKKYNIHFIAYEKPVRLDNSYKNIMYHKVDIPHYPLFEYPPYELALTAKIVQVVEEFKLDILHVHYAIPHAYSAVNAQSILLKKNIIIPIVTTLHGTDITLVGSSPFVLPAVNYAISKSNLITAVSEDLKKETLSIFNINHDILVIPNFIFPNKKVPFKHDEKRKKKLLHISNFRPVKRINDVIKVFAGVNSKIPSELIMIGDGPELESAKLSVKQLGLEQDVRFLGRSKDIDKFLQASDLFLLPSETESFGLVALEAMSFGVPVIASNSGGIPELVINGFNGYTYAVGDVKSMIKGALRLLTDSHLYDKFNNNAYETAEKYNVSDIVCLYEDAYMSLLN
jgi:N-acetyl-alpha-D-glucosaminyl L-malate synthase BshA